MFKKTNLLKISILIIIVIICFSLWQIILTEQINTLENLENTLDSIESDFNNKENSFQQNKSELEKYQQGNMYEIHDPFYEEVLSFIENNNLLSINKIIYEGKNQGLKTAYIQVIMGEELLMYELIAFNTVDEGMVYFEPIQKYRLTPEIGKRYRDCTINHHQTSTFFNDTIVDIITIW